MKELVSGICKYEIVTTALYQRRYEGKVEQMLTYLQPVGPSAFELLPALLESAEEKI